MQQLSELDSSFLYLETDRTPLHVGGIFVFKRPNADSPLDFSLFKKIMASKMASEPFFRERLVEYPLNLDLPIWADDPEFDLSKHINHERLTNDSLLETASLFFSQALDREKPLWEAKFIEGLEQDSNELYDELHFALFLKVHITAIDGVTGEDILSQLLDVSPAYDEPEAPQEWTPTPLPDTGSWIGAAYNNVLNIPAKLTLLAKDTAASAFYSLLNERLASLNLPANLMKVGSTPMNQRISMTRTIENIEIPLSKVRSIKQNIGGSVTTNDVMMGICAEAIARYLEDMDAESNQDLIALAPLSVRSTSLDVKSGNQLSATLFSLASSEKDPLKRICLIHKAAKSANHYDSAIAASHLTQLVPSRIAGLSARVYSEFLLAQKHKPLFNLPIINIPGPQFPLYFQDAELTQFISTAPLFDGIGLALMIVSYNGHYSITSTYDPNALTLRQPFKNYIEDALEEILNCETTQCNDAMLSDDHSSNNKTGFIEDVTGLVSNLFSPGK